MNSVSAKQQTALELARSVGMIRIRDCTAHGIHPEHIRRLCEKGLLERVSRGCYRPVEAAMTEHHGLALVAKVAPEAVICLLSALQFHVIGTQLPRAVWIAISGRARRPQLDFPPVRVWRFSGAAFTSGVEQHRLEGVPVQIYSPAKTVADCFKYRNKIGLEVALEALQEGWRERRFNISEVWREAHVCRVANVMRPYLESLP